MTQWLLEKIGIESDITSRLEHAEWSLSHPLALWLGLAFLVPVGWFIFSRHRRNLPHVAPLFRNILSCCRVAVLALLVVVLSGPQIRVREPGQQKPILAFLVDESESMQLPAGPFALEQAAPLARAAGLLDGLASKAPEDGERVAQPVASPELREQLDSMPRRELVKRVLQTQSPVVKQLGRRCELRCYRFARSVVRSSLEGIGLSGEAKSTAPEEETASETPDLDTLGPTTAIGSALQLAVAEASGQPVAGIVILSDGRVTAGPNPQHLVGEDGEVGGIPIWSIPAGSRRGLDDVSLLGVITPQNIAMGDTVNIVATVRARGFSGAQAEVELLEGQDVVDRSPITLGSGEEQSVTLRLRTKEPGTRLLTVRVERKPGEKVTRNNEQQVTLQVDQQKWRVLYLEGWPRWDFRFLDHAFRRDHGLEVEMVMESQLREKRRQLAEEKKKAEEKAKEAESGGPGASSPPDEADGPQDEEADKAMPPLTSLVKLPADASAVAEYDVVVLGDVSPELLTPKFQEALVRAVKEKAVGLILQAGTQHLPHAYGDLPLGGLVPLDVAASAVGRGGMQAEAFSPFALAVTDAGFLYPAFRPYDQLANNQEIWGRMPDLHWALDARESGSATRVLAEVKTLEGLQPLIAERYAGKGRIFLIGTDSTYRWKKNIGDQLFYPFWGRTIRQLAHSRHRQQDPSWVEAYPRRAELGEAVDLELYAVGRDQRPLSVAQVEVRVKSSEKQEAETVTLEGYGEPGWFRGVWEPSRLGDFRLQYTDPAGKTASAEVRVAASGREFLRPSVDWQNFGQLAEASNGGALLQLHEFARLPKLVQGQPTDVVRDYEAQLWDNWLVLMVLAGLYCLDIVIRRLLSLT